MNFVDECNSLIDHLHVEKCEQDLATLFIEPYDVVLELGARYGTVSCAINNRLIHPTHQVSVEPQLEVQNALEINRNANKCKFHIWKGFVSKQPVHLEDYGYGATFHSGFSEQYPCISLEELQEKYNLKFDTLVADCEGGLGLFFEQHDWFYSQLRKIIFEKDYPQKCDYNKIMDKLKEHGFKCIHSMNDGFHEVWKKNSEVIPSSL